MVFCGLSKNIGNSLYRCNFIVHTDKLQFGTFPSGKNVNGSATARGMHFLKTSAERLLLRKSIQS